MLVLAGGQLGDTWANTARPQAQRALLGSPPGEGSAQRGGWGTEQTVQMKMETRMQVLLAPQDRGGGCAGLWPRVGPQPPSEGRQRPGSLPRGKGALRN